MSLEGQVAVGFFNDTFSPDLTYRNLNDVGRVGAVFEAKK